MSTILVPLDGSPLAEQALPHACRLALITGSRLLLVRAAVPVVDPDARITSRSSVQHAEAYLNAVRDRLQTDGFTVEVASLFSNAVPAILRAAKMHEVSTIVMSTHGRTGLRRMVLGSVTEQVVQESQVPVLIVNGESPRVEIGDRYRRILVPLDGSSFAEAAVESLKNLGVGEGAEIVLLHSVQPPSPMPLNQREEQDLALRQKDARDYLGRVAAIAPDGHMYRLLTPIEDPATAILESVGTQELDLIVIAAHARRGRVRFSQTSVAGQVLRDTGTPVLIVRGVDEVEPLPETALPEVEQSECEEDNYFDEFLFV